jgi:KUP system potassium uptake protein
VRYGYKDIRKEDNDFEDQLILHIAGFIEREVDQQSATGSSFETDGMVVACTPGFTGMQLITQDSGDSMTITSASSSKSPTLQSFEATSEMESRQLRRRVTFELPKSPDISPAVIEEMRELLKAKEAGVAYILGHSYVKAKKTSTFLKKLVIDVGYSFLRKNCRGPTVALSIPHICLIEVGMIYLV